MRLIKECIAITMSPDDRKELRAHLIELHDHVEEYFKARGDVDAGSPDGKLMTSMERVYDFCRLLDAGEFA